MSRQEKPRNTNQCGERPRSGAAERWRAAVAAFLDFREGGLARRAAWFALRWSERQRRRRPVRPTLRRFARRRRIAERSLRRWMRAYRAGGWAALRDGRGRRPGLRPIDVEIWRRFEQGRRAGHSIAAAARVVQAAVAGSGRWAPAIRTWQARLAAGAAPLSTGRLRLWARPSAVGGRKAAR